MRCIVLAIASVIALPAFAAADEIQDQLDAARTEYEIAIASIETEVKDFFQQAIAEYQDQGDLEKTLTAQGLQEMFSTEGVLHDVPSLRALRQKVKPKYLEADRDYRIAQMRAIQDYTRAKEIEAAKEVKRSLDQFDASQKDAMDKRFPVAKAPKREAADKPEQAKEDSPARDTTKQMKRGKGLTPWATKIFDYSTNDGICNVGEGDMKFGINFGECGANSVYVYSDDPSVRRVASVRGAAPGVRLRFVDFDSTSRVYEINEKQVFLAENENGYYMVGRIVVVHNLDRGDGGDVVEFDYSINQTQGEDALVAPPLR